MTEAELNTMPVKNGFRLRGSAMTRLEAFSDAAFAFAMSMLVISVGEIPKNYQDLILALKGTPAFAASFGSIMLFWIGHRTWSRRFGLEDAFSIFLSFALVFTVLVYLYPLKIVFSAFFTWISGGWLPSNFTLYAVSELTGLFIIYGVGLSLLAGTLAALNWRAIHLADQLLLNKEEYIKTAAAVTAWMVISVTAAISALYAWIAPANLEVYAGFVYFSLPVTMPLISIYFRKKFYR